jgi:protein ImuB
MFGALHGPEGTPPGVLADVAREFSPRIEIDAPRDVVLDLSGLTRLFGDARTIAEHMRRTAADRGVRVRVAIAGTRAAARLLVRHRAGLTVVEPGTEASALAALPLTVLTAVAIDPHSVVAVFRRWGLRTLGDLAALPSDEVVSRLGHDGTEWQRLARGEDPRPLVPAVPEERFEQSLELEWPIEEIEPLSFVLGRLMEPLAAHLEQRDRGAAVLHVRLDLVKTAGAARDVFERSLQLPFPIRDARTLRTLALLDLESHPPPAAIDRVTVAVDPTPARIVQWSLLSRSLPSPEHISTLMARLQALMGETRCGSPVVVDSWQPGALEMKPFAPADTNAVHPRYDTQRHRDTENKTSRSLSHSLRASVPRCVVEANDASKQPVVALRRFRHPVPVRVQAEHGRPSSLMTMRRGLSGGKVESCAGPWRTSGGWWASEAGRAGGAWDRDEWDVALTGGATYRLLRERNTNRWFVEGVFD